MYVLDLISQPPDKSVHASVFEEGRVVQSKVRQVEIGWEILNIVLDESRLRFEG